MKEWKKQQIHHIMEGKNTSTILDCRPLYEREKNEKYVIGYVNKFEGKTSAMRANIFPIELPVDFFPIFSFLSKGKLRIW